VVAVDKPGMVIGEVASAGESAEKAPYEPPAFVESAYL
jgi:hypothetical protein